MKGLSLICLLTSVLIVDLAIAKQDAPVIDQETRAAIIEATIKNLDAVVARLDEGGDLLSPDSYYLSPFEENQPWSYRRAVRAIRDEVRYKEMVRRDNIALIAHYMYDSDEYKKDEVAYAQFRLWALRCLKANDVDIRLAGLEHLTVLCRTSENTDIDADRKVVRTAIVQMLRDTQGRFPETYMALPILTNEDAPAVRAVYDKRYAGQPMDYDPISSVGARDLGIVENRGNQRSALESLLAKLHDPQIEEELDRALKQNDDPSRKAWALVKIGVAARTDCNPMLLEALSDKTPVPIAIDDHVRDPEAKGPYLQAIVYQRVCDIAARSLYYANEGILNGLKSDRFDFFIPTPGVRCSQAATTFNYHEPISSREPNRAMGRFERIWIMGFTDEQLKQLHDHYSQVKKPTEAGPIVPVPPPTSPTSVER